MKFYRIGPGLTCLLVVAIAPPVAAWGKLIIHYPTKSAVVQNRPNAIAVLFPEKVGLWLDKKGPMVGGIQRITVGQHRIFGAIPGGAKAPLATLITGGRIRPVSNWAAYLRRRGGYKAMPGFYNTPASFKFRNFPGRGRLKMDNALPLAGKYLGWRREGKWTCIRVGLRHGTVDWLVGAAKARIGHAVYRGIQWKLRMRGAGKVISVGLEEPFVVQAGDWHFTQRWGKFSQVQLEIAGKYHLNWNPGGVPYDYYFAGRQPFFFAAGRAGATISYFGKIAPVAENELQEGRRLMVNLQIPVRPVKGVIETPPARWLFARGDYSSKWRALNEWARVSDFTGHYYRSLAGTKRVDPLPTLFAFGKPGRGGESFRKIANDLPRAAKIGFKVLFVSALESTVDKPATDYLTGSSNNPNTCAIWRTKISPHFGGGTELKRLCGAAHRVGIKVITWSATSDLSNSAPLLSEHPSWPAWNANGTPMNVGYADVVGVNFRRGDLNYVLRQYRKIRQATGIDGMWQDSFLTFGVLTDFSAEHPYPQLDQSVKLLREEQAIGCRYVMIEGCGPFGLSSGGYGLGDPVAFKKFIQGKEYGLYYFCADTALEPHSYYRILASKGGVWFELGYAGNIPILDRLPKSGRRFIIAANHDYMAVLPYMKQRHLVGKGKKWLGVEWLDGGKPRVLFAFAPMPWKVPADAKIRDVTTGADHIATPGAPGFPTRAWHTYLLIK